MGINPTNLIYNQLPMITNEEDFAKVLRELTVGVGAGFSKKIIYESLKGFTDGILKANLSNLTLDDRKEIKASINKIANLLTTK